MPRAFTLTRLVVLSILVQALNARPATAQFCECPPFGPLAGPASAFCNITWSLVDSLAACPAGDSLFFTRPANRSLPARLRIWVHYEDNDCNPKVGVPPESIYVTYSIATGNLKVNDKGVKVFADDSTDAFGNTRITIPSFSGCGRLRVVLNVSGTTPPLKLAYVRTTDTNADGRTTSADLVSICNVNYTGSADAGDTSLVNAHVDHWKRNVLHGTLVRRTNLTDPPYYPHLGGSVNFWSPSGRWLAYTVGDTVLAGSGCPAGHGCYALILASDPKDGNKPRQFTFEDTTNTYSAYPYCPPYRDYDPDWSPLGNEIVFDRDDWTIFRKGIPGVAGVADTSLHLVTQSGSHGLRGDASPSYSPNGQWVAFTRWDTSLQAFNLWKIPIGGGTATRLTQPLPATLTSTPAGLRTGRGSSSTAGTREHSNTRRLTASSRFLPTGRSTTPRESMARTSPPRAATP